MNACFSRSILVAATLAATTALCAPARAEDDAPAWLGAIGSFVRDGLGPARTAEDVLREERERAAAREAAPREAERKKAPVAKPEIAIPAPEAEPATVPALSTPIAPAPLHAAPPPARSPAPKQAVAKPEQPPAPKKVVVQAPPPPEPPPASRIAATATLDQAVRLGGPGDFYTLRPKKAAQPK